MSYIVPQKIPLRCFECGHISLSTIDGYGCKIAHKSVESEPGINVRRPDWCPLVDIPAPHGRLIDVDDFMRHLIINTADLRTLSTGTVGKALHDTPTVIEAEEVTE